MLDVGLSTVETHRANLMQKLDLHNTAEIVLYAVRKAHHRLIAAAAPSGAVSPLHPMAPRRGKVCNAVVPCGEPRSMRKPRPS